MAVHVIVIVIMCIFVVPIFPFPAGPTVPVRGGSGRVESARPGSAGSQRYDMLLFLFVSQLRGRRVIGLGETKGGF